MALKDMGLVPLIIDIDDDIIKPLFAKEGDYRSRGIELQILNKGKEIDTSGVIVEFFAKPRDGKVYVVEATPVDTTKGKYEIVYPSSILQPGVVKCEIRLVKMTDDEIDEIITTKSFNLKVYETIADEDIFEGIDIEPIVEILVQAARNEEERIQAENERIQAENTRIQNENERKSNEQIRQQKEDERQQNEITRQTNEQTRQQNEQQRIDLYNALKDLDVSQYELRLQKLEHDTSVEEFILEETYGSVISLPSNAVNGQINEVTIGGLTVTNILGDLGDFEDLNKWSKELNYGTLDNTKKVFGNYSLRQIKNNQNGYLHKDNIPLKKDKYYFLSLYRFVEVPSAGPVSIRLYDNNTFTNAQIITISFVDTDNLNVWERIGYKFQSTKDICRFMIGGGGSTTTTYNIDGLMLIEITEEEYNNLSVEELMQKYQYINGTKSTICAIRLKSVNEDESKESALYVLGKDKEGNILELRSLPNGTKDEIDVANRKLIKRIGEKANVSSGTVINYTDMAEGGTYYAWNDNGETETGTKGDTLGINATVLIYQLAQPIEMPVEVFGNLQSYENGTIYVDTIVPRVDFYTSEGIVLEENDVPIKEIDSLYLVNKENGLLTPLDISKASIFPDGRGFTHPDLFTGALVDWDYIPDVKSTNPTISMKLPTNLKASVTSALQGVQELSSETKNLNTRVIANRRDIYNLQDNFATLQSDVSRISNELDTHKADYVNDMAKKANKQQEDWTNLTLQNGWTVDRYARVFKDEFGIVFLQIDAVGGVNDGGTEITRLPAKFRPDVPTTLFVSTGDIRFTINSGNGALVLSGNHPGLDRIGINIAFRGVD